MKQWPLLRDAILFVTGLAGVLHETVLTQAERPTLLILFAAMMGLPAFLRPNGTGSIGGSEVGKEKKEVENKEQDQLSEGDSKDGV